MNEEEPIQLPMDGILDLHYFKPGDVKELVPEYIDACLDNDITSIRIIHGKGKGVLRRIVHSILENNPSVKSYRLADDRSGWGATLVELYNEE